MLLEDQKKKRGWMARQEPDTMSDSQDQGLRRDDLGLHKLAQSSPVKKNASLGEYFSRRKGSQPGSAGAATGPKLSDLPRVGGNVTRSASPESNFLRTPDRKDQRPLRAQRS